MINEIAGDRVRLTTIVGPDGDSELYRPTMADAKTIAEAKIVFMKSDQTNEQASIQVTEIKTGNVVFAYSVNKANSYKGKQSAGEAIGKHLNEAIGKD